MPIEFGAGKLYVCNAGGEPVEVAEIKDVATFVADDLANIEPVNGLELKARGNTVYTARICGVHNRRRLVRVAYGWTAKGPVRKRILRRLFMDRF